MDINKMHNEILGNKVVEALKENYFDAVYFEDSMQAKQYILDNLKQGTKVAFGGSMTIKSMGIKEEAAKKKCVVFDHGEASLTPEEKLKVMRQELISDVFLCSSNAVTLQGELVNIDGAGNRVAAMTFGPEKVIIVVGINKIVMDEDEAFKRLKQIACPKNSIRLEKSNPCTKTGVCVDCKSQNRICRVYSVIKRRPSHSNITIIVVGENLGY